ncbi:C40 family peptidase [Streptomyces milbemycinicus]|uniref:C40 family peptidase n=1 Tax=Streptomyces milbemycinicus TaxID=476552 RepID=UPI0033F6FA66
MTEQTRSVGRVRPATASTAVAVGSLVAVVVGVATVGVHGPSASATVPTSASASASASVPRPSAADCGSDDAREADIRTPASPASRVSKAYGALKNDPKPAPKPAPRPVAAVIVYAKGQLGKPYRWGGVGPRGFDSAGLVMRAWGAAGVNLPRSSWEQSLAGTPTTRSGLVPGDIVLSHRGAHVVLYIGGGRVIHAPRPGTRVTIAPLPPSSQVVAYRHIGS